MLVAGIVTACGTGTVSSGHVAGWTDQLLAELLLGVEPGAETITFTWGAHPEREDCSTGDGTRTGAVRIDGRRAGSISLPGPSSPRSAFLVYRSLEYSLSEEAPWPSRTAPPAS
jgi:hypothetical protein